MWRSPSPASYDRPRAWFVDHTPSRSCSRSWGRRPACWECGCARWISSSAALAAWCFADTLRPPICSSTASTPRSSSASGCRSHLGLEPAWYSGRSRHDDGAEDAAEAPRSNLHTITHISKKSRRGVAALKYPGRRGCGRLRQVDELLLPLRGTESAAARVIGGR